MLLKRDSHHHHHYYLCAALLLHELDSPHFCFVFHSTASSLFHFTFIIVALWRKRKKVVILTTNGAIVSCLAFQFSSVYDRDCEQ